MAKSVDAKIEQSIGYTRIITTEQQFITSLKMKNNREIRVKRLNVYVIIVCKSIHYI